MQKLILLLTTVLLLSFTPADKVLICISKGSSKYHTHYCQGLNHCKHEVQTVTVAEAKKRGYSECGYCYR